jgi:integrating conjugative element protein (TIGR03746 family)
MRYRDKTLNMEAHIHTLRWMIGLQLLVIAALWHGWERARGDVRIHIPPDLRSGAVIKANDIGPANVYAFAQYIVQQANHWPDDGSKDYGMQIFRLSPYLTPRFRSFLTADMAMRGKRGELSGRTRLIQIIPGHGYEERRVEILDDSTWIVWLDYDIKEYVRGMPVKQVSIRYPVRVVRHDVDPESNPWGLAVDGFAGEGPRHLAEEDLAGEETDEADRENAP